MTLETVAKLLREVEVLYFQVVTIFTLLCCSRKNICILRWTEIQNTTTKPIVINFWLSNSRNAKILQIITRKLVGFIMSIQKEVANILLNLLYFTKVTYIVSHIIYVPFVMYNKCHNNKGDSTDRRRDPRINQNPYPSWSYTKRNTENDNEYRYHPDVLKTALCKNGTNCKLHDICPDIHPDEEEFYKEKFRASMSDIELTLFRVPSFQRTCSSQPAHSSFREFYEQ